MAKINISKELQIQLLSDNKLKENISEVENYEEFYQKYIKYKNIKNTDYYFFFYENKNDDIKETLEFLGYNFEKTKKRQFSTSTKYTYEYDKKIIDYLERLYPDKKIKSSVKKLISDLEKNNLVLEIQDIQFFYLNNDSEIISYLNDLGFKFVDTEFELSKIKKQAKISINDKISDYEKRESNLNKFQNNKERKSFIFDNTHPESYYAITQNIPEMKLRMIEDEISYKENINNQNLQKYSEIFNLENEEIEQYFSKIVKRRANKKDNKTGALIKATKDIKHETLHYRLISLFDSDWIESSNWMKFFFSLGEFVELYQGNLSVFISYIERTIPASLVSVGIMNKYFLEKRNYLRKINNLDDSYQINEIVFYKDGKDWRKATVIGITNKKGKEEFNPYLELLVERSIKDGEATNESVPYKLWENKIRSGGISKGSSGRSSIVKINDRISEVLTKRYSKETVRFLRMYPELHVNLIGTRVNKKIRSLREEIQFSDEKGSFMLTDVLYFDNDNESNYVNVHMVSSDKSTAPEENSISIFVGSKMGLDFQSYKTNKNIYFTSRIRENYIEDTELLINLLQQNSSLSNIDKNKISKELKKYLSKNNIEIPKGCEIGVY